MFAFLKSWVWWLCICVLGFIFLIDPFWKNMFLMLKGPHLLQSCLHVTRNGLPLAAREMHLSFESLAVIATLGFQASLMDIHHDTSSGLSWKMTPFFQHLNLAFIFVQIRGHGYGRLVGHLSVCFTLHILFSFQCCIFVSI
jgi:hypothetical protein